MQKPAVAPVTCCCRPPVEPFLDSAAAPVDKGKFVRKTALMRCEAGHDCGRNRALTQPGVANCFQLGALRAARTRPDRDICAFFATGPTSTVSPQAIIAAGGKKTRRAQFPSLFRKSPEPIPASIGRLATRGEQCPAAASNRGSNVAVSGRGLGKIATRRPPRGRSGADPGSGRGRSAPHPGPSGRAGAGGGT